MAGWSKARIQLCGRFVADIDGSPIEDTLPGRRGRVMFAYLVLNRGRALPREELGIAPSPTVQAVHRRLLDGAGS